MSILYIVLIIIGQLAAAAFLGPIAAALFGIGNNFELIIFALGSTIGVWGVGALAGRWLKPIRRPASRQRLAGTAVGALLGVAIILITPAMGFGPIAFPILGALLGYYIAPQLRR